MVQGPKRVANKRNINFFLCFTETNNFIIFFQFYNKTKINSGFAKIAKQGATSSLLDINNYFIRITSHIPLLYPHKT